MSRAGQAGRDTRTEVLPAIRSPVYWALLGLVIERAGYGYELLKRFERDYGETLPLSSDSHVYRALGVLEQRGLVEELPGGEGEHGSRQPRPHYRATPKGVCGYRDWLIWQAGARLRQSTLFARELAVLVDRPETALEVLEQCERACLERAAREESEAGARARDGSVETLAAALESEERRLASARELSWIAFARERFTALREDRISANGPA